MTYNTTFMDGALSYGDVVVGTSNNLTGGVAVTLMLVGLGIVFFTSFRNVDTKTNLTVTFFILSILSFILWTYQVIPEETFIAILVGFFAFLVMRLITGAG